MKKSTQKTNGKNIFVLLGLMLTTIFLFFSVKIFAGDIKIKEGNADLKIKTSTYTNFDFTNTFTEVSYRNVKTDKGTFCELSVPGYGFSNRVGDPKLPMLRKLVEIPYGAAVNVNVISYSETEYKLSDYGISEKLMPAQPPVYKDCMKDFPDIEYNTTIYVADQFNTDNLVSVNVLGTMRGVTIARLDIAPIRYNPVTNTIKIYNDIEVEITFQNGDITRTIADKEKTFSPYFESMYFNQLLNYKETAAKDSLTKYPVKYVIISDPMFQTILQPFIQWKTRKGFTVVEGYTDNPGVGTTTTSIKNYLQNLYNNATPSDPAPSFVLIVGDVAQVPSFPGNTGSHVSDMYYCEYTGDYFPEVYYGRFSATNTTQLQPQIDKTLEYEEYTMLDPSFLAECVMIAGQDATYGPLYGDGQINYGTDEYFNTSHGLTSHTYLYAVSGSSAAAIIQDVSEGVCFANYTAHGGSDGWSDPAFSISDISGLQNNHKYPLLIGNACSTNTFDGNCFGEELLRAANKGALGYIGGSNSTLWDEDYWWACGYKTVVVNPVYDAGTLGAYDRTFHDHGEARSEWYASQDQMIFAGNLGVTQSGSSETEYYWEIYHLMGDPSLMIYYGIPSQLNATYTPLIPLGAVTFTVNTEPWAYVAVSMNNILYGAALADTNGVATITLNPFTIPGTADVVATKQNRSPFIGTVTVASPTDPYIVYTNKVLHDVAGNNNGQADYNENITLDITLQNVGAATANGVIAVLSTADTNVIITDNTQNWGNIANGTSSTQNNAYAITIKNFIPDQHIVNFDLAITDGSSNSWSGSFTLTLNAPSLSIGTILISDPTGNNNGRLDPGETADIYIVNSNNGHAIATATQSNLSTTSTNDITLNTYTANLGNLNAGGGTANAAFNLTVSPTAPIGYAVDLINVVTAGSYSSQKTFFLTIGLVDEDWETCDFTKFDWVQGTYPWIITGTLPYEGAYAAKSGTITDEQVSDLSITFNVLADDSISFYAKVSSEATYDFMKFYIDGVEKGSWSGEMNWTRKIYPVTLGSHTFKWTYEKDQSVSDGSDCAWTDYILFPPFQTFVHVTDNNEVENTMNCYPNPFTNHTMISYSLEKPGIVSLKIYNAMGQEIAILINGKNQQAGYYNEVFNTGKLETGIYHCVLTVPDKTVVKKLLIQ